MYVKISTLNVKISTLNSFMPNYFTVIELFQQLPWELRVGGNIKLPPMMEVWVDN